MSGIEYVFCGDAPPPAASYSPAVKVTGMVYCSGQIPLDADGKMVTGGVEEQAVQMLENLRAVLQAAGSSLKQVVKVNVFLADMDDFARFNTVYARYFNEHKPARSCVAVAALPLQARMEMECIAVSQ